MNDHLTPAVLPQPLQQFDQAFHALALSPRWDLLGLPRHHFPALRRLVLGLLLGAKSIRAAWVQSQPYCVEQAIQALYDCLDDPRVDLAALLRALTPGHRTTEQDLLLIDDTVTRSYGEHIAGVTWQHDHNSKAEFWGHNVVLLYHRSPQGPERFVDLAVKMNTHQPESQIQPGRPPKTIRQARRKKWQLALDLVRTAKARGHRADVLLCDAGYAHTDFLRELVTAGLHFVTRLPSNRAIGLGLTAKQWLAGKRSYKRLRGTGYYFAQTYAWLAGVGFVKLVAYWPCHTRAGKDRGRFLVTDQLRLSAYEVVTQYLRRWGIEPAIHEARQAGGLDEGHVRGWHNVGNYYALALVAHAVAAEMHRQTAPAQLGVVGYIQQWRQDLHAARVSATQRARAELFKTKLWQHGFSTRSADHRRLLELVDAAFLNTG
jgi:hypothetical protein